MSKHRARRHKFVETPLCQKQPHLLTDNIIMYRSEKLIVSIRHFHLHFALHIATFNERKIVITETRNTGCTGTNPSLQFVMSFIPQANKNILT